MKWGWYVSCLAQSSGLTGIQWTAAAGTRWGERGVWCGASPPSPLLLLSSHTIVGALGNCQAPWGMILSLQEQRVREGRDAPTRSQRWARVWWLPWERKERSLPSRDSKRLGTWRNGREVCWQRLRGRTVSGEKGLIKAAEVKNCAQGVLNGCDTGTQRQLKETGKKLVAAHLCTGLTYQAMESRLCLVKSRKP